jgi:polyprenyl P-hydroxybenzoate/phenylacrylic acid decarboxylase-like protein
MKQMIVAITGATGSWYGLRLIERLTWEPEVRIHVVISPWGERVMFEETGKSFAEWISPYPQDVLVVHAHENLAASISSGSFPADAMVVVPCTMGTLGAIASGLASNLIERSASVALKERRPLILVARETPLSSIQLEQMLRLSQSGAIILPPEPTFYNKPKTIEDIIDSTVDRILDLLRIRQDSTRRWS